MNHTLDTAFNWIIDHIVPSFIIYYICRQTWELYTDTIPVLPTLVEMKRRGLIDYYCALHMVHTVIRGHTPKSIENVTVGDVLTIYKRVKKI